MVSIAISSFTEGESLVCFTVPDEVEAAEEEERKMRKLFRES
jgi:hypothetical protein